MSKGVAAIFGSHHEYDKIDVRKVAYGDQAYQKRKDHDAIRFRFEQQGLVS